MNRAALGVPLCGTGLPLFARMQGTLLRRYAGSSENFVLVKTGITAVLSFELRVLSKDGNQLNSKLKTHYSQRKSCEAIRSLCGYQGAALA